MATTFTLFLLLPTEIRLQIWTYAQTPRILKVHVNPDPRAPERPWDVMTNLRAWESRHKRVFCFRSTTPRPAILAVNHESREYGLESPRQDTLWVEQYEYSDDWAMLVQRMETSSSRTHLRSLAICDIGILHTDRPNIAMLVKAGIQELFLISEKASNCMPSVWSLPLRQEDLKVNLISLAEAEWIVELRTIYRQFKDVVGERLDGVVPRVTVASRSYWEKNGSELKSFWVT